MHGTPHDRTGQHVEENQETCRSIAEELLQTVPVPKESLWN